MKREELPASFAQHDLGLDDGLRGFEPGRIDVVPVAERKIFVGR